MMKHKSSRAILLGMLLCGAAATAAPQTKYVTDAAGFFSKDAAESAEKAFGDLSDRDRHEVRMLTFPEIPADNQDAFKAQGKEAFYDGWSRELLQTERADVLILMTRDPRRLQIATSRDAEKAWLPKAERDALRDEMLAKFRTDQFDEGLSHAVRRLTDRSK